MKYTFLKIPASSDENFQIGNIINFDEGMTEFPTNEFGFLFVPNGISYPDGDIILVLSYAEADIISMYDNIDIVSKFSIRYKCQNTDNILISFVDFNELSTPTAFLWGMVFGDKDIMKNYIDEYEFVSWVKYVYPEDRSRVLSLISSEEVFCNWGVEIGDRDIIRNHIISPKYAFTWAVNIPDERINMKPLINDPIFIQAWNFVFPEDKII